MCFMNRARRAALGAVLLVLAASEAAAQAEGAGSPQRVLQDPRLLDAAEIRAQILAGMTQLDLVVTLEPELVMRAFRDWDDGEKAGRHRAGVTTLQRSVLDTLTPAQFQGRRFLENVPVFAGRASLEGLAKLLADPRVASVELDGQVEAHTSQGIALMNASGPRGVFSGSRLSIAIVDTGIYYTHAALGGGGFPNAKVIGGYDFGDNDANPIDQHGHGTNVAGVAAGDVVPSGDYIGGVAPGARLYALKIVQGGVPSAWDSDIQAAWDWCVTHKNDDPAHPILVVNTSFGGGMYSSPCMGGAYATSAAALKSAGIMNFVSAGNDGYCAAIASPACYADVISVGAVYDANLGNNGWCISSNSCIGSATAGCSTGWLCFENALAGAVTCYSNSASFLDLLAPSTLAHVPAMGGHSDFNGTSAASPYAAGAAAVFLDALLASNTALTPDDVLSRFVSTGVATFDLKSGITKPLVDLGAAFATLADVWVDFAYTGIENGSVNRPFNALVKGVNAAPSGGRIMVKAGMRVESPLPIVQNVSIRSWGGSAVVK